MSVKSTVTIECDGEGCKARTKDSATFLHVATTYSGPQGSGAEERDYCEEHAAPALALLDKHGIISIPKPSDGGE